jgi:WhiB family transcriptional regulator, redox-sensing transcriptional regulator
MYTSITNPTSGPFTGSNTLTNPGTKLLDKDSAMHSLLIAPLDSLPSQVSSVIEPKEPDSPPGYEELDGQLETRALKAPVARCADGHGTMVGLFFSDNIIDIARAKAMCNLCPLKASCLTDALEREEPWGVWGGELLSGGRIIANKRACGRPPTRPRPELVIDELGPVGVVA